MRMEEKIKNLHKDRKKLLQKIDLIEEAMQDNFGFIHSYKQDDYFRIKETIKFEKWEALIKHFNLNWDKKKNTFTIKK